MPYTHAFGLRLNVTILTAVRTKAITVSSQLAKLSSKPREQRRVQLLAEPRLLKVVTPIWRTLAYAEVHSAAKSPPRVTLERTTHRRADY